MSNFLKNMERYNSYVFNDEYTSIDAHYEMFVAKERSKFLLCNKKENKQPNVIECSSKRVKVVETPKPSPPPLNPKPARNEIQTYIVHDEDLTIELSDEEGVAAAATKPKPKSSQSTNPTKGKIRPRVDKSKVIVVKEGTEETLAQMTVGRSQKIRPSENQENIVRIKEYSQVLERVGMFERYLNEVRAYHPEPFRRKFELPDNTSLCSRLNRKATDHYNKMLFLWHKDEVHAMKAYIEAHNVSYI